MECGIGSGNGTSQTIAEYVESRIHLRDIAIGVVTMLHLLLPADMPE